MTGCMRWSTSMGISGEPYSRIDSNLIFTEYSPSSCSSSSLHLPRRLSHTSHPSHYPRYTNPRTQLIRIIYSRGINNLTSTTRRLRIPFLLPSLSERGVRHKCASILRVRCRVDWTNSKLMHGRYRYVVLSSISYSASFIVQRPRETAPISSKSRNPQVAQSFYS